MGFGMRSAFPFLNPNGTAAGLGCHSAPNRTGHQHGTFSTAPVGFDTNALP